MSYVAYTTDLTAIRAFVHHCATTAGLPEDRIADLMLAVGEVASNTVRHARSPGSLSIWYDATEIICQIHDEGVIADPLAGKREPPLDTENGRGLWIVHQVCDQVELQSGNGDGTTIRMHMLLPPR